VPPGSPKIKIHTRGGKCVGIYCNLPAKVLLVETQDDPRRTVQCPHLDLVVGGLGTSLPQGRAIAAARHPNPSRTYKLNRMAAASDSLENPLGY
jgi:hypothetical protein